MHRDRDWLIPVTAIVAVQAAFAVGVNAIVGRPASPPLGQYFLAYATFLTMAACVFVLFTLGRMSLKREDLSFQSLLDAFYSNWQKLFAGFIGVQLFTLSAGFITWTKAMMPYALGFRWDVWLADADRWMFGADPWVYVSPFMWLLEPVYALWFAVMMLVFVVLLTSEPSNRRNRAIVAFFLTWALGSLAAFFMPAAGPVFYERIGLGPRFAELPLTDLFRFESDHLWAAHIRGDAGAAVGISAMPSMHVAMSLWIVLALRAVRSLFLPALSFYLLIWIGSVATGWHYALDGLAGSILALASYALVNSYFSLTDEKAASTTLQSKPA